MRTAMRPRYYCDFCNKGNGSPSAMKRHERGCTMNPQRVCGMCKLLSDEGGPEMAPQRDELLKVMDADGFPAMCTAAHDCPACILSALRARNVKDEYGPFRVPGPEDGRNEWIYTKAKEEWWASWNTCQSEKETHYPHY